MNSQIRKTLVTSALCPFDYDRLALFDTLCNHLRAADLPNVPATADVGVARENFAFFEAYFSNCIEGPDFHVSDAEEIVFKSKLISSLTENSLDMLGTFQAAMQTPWRNQPPQTAEEFLLSLKNINAIVMRYRLDQNPGEWKDQNHQACETRFARHQFVQSTLLEGFEFIQILKDPFARALMTMFVISEVQPFKDGNGRTARLAMNCELSAAGCSRIIVPTILRQYYLLSLKSLSTYGDPKPYIGAMTRAQSWTTAFDYAQRRHDLYETFKRCNAFKEYCAAYRLVFPEAQAGCGANNSLKAHAANDRSSRSCTRRLSGTYLAEAAPPRLLSRNDERQQVAETRIP